MESIWGPNSYDEVCCYDDLDGSELCENVVYLGRQGAFTTNEGGGEDKKFRYRFILQGVCASVDLLFFTPYSVSSIFGL